MNRHWQRLYDSVRWLWQQAAITARLAVGVPDYDIYLQHQRNHHGQRTPMSREEFYRDRLQARYAKGSSRCC